MGEIEVLKEPGWVRFRVHAAATIDDFLQTIGEHYPQLAPARLWDLRGFAVDQLSPGSLKQLAGAVESAVDGKNPTKVALLVEDPADYRFACKYLVQPTRLRARAEAAVFLKEDDAARWLLRD